MSIVEPTELTAAEVDEILAKPDGPFLLLELVRMGYIDAERAVTAIEEADRQPWWKRVGYALLNALSSP